MEKAGIYRIVNTLTKKYYLGSALDLDRRKKAHLNKLKNNKHHSKKLQNSFNKYGEGVFVFEIMEQVYFPNDYSNAIKIEYLQCLEQYYLDLYILYKLGYNMSSKTDYPAVKRTKESLEKARNTRVRNGTTMSQETKFKISVALKNSEKWKSQHKEMSENRRQPVYQYDLEGNFIKEWEHRQKVCEVFLIKYQNLDAVIFGKNNQIAGFMFKNYKLDKIAAFRNRKIKKVVVLELKTNKEIVFNSSKQCEHELNLKKGTIAGCIRLQKTHKKIYFFKYFN